MKRPRRCGVHSLVRHGPICSTVGEIPSTSPPPPPPPPPSPPPSSSPPPSTPAPSLVPDRTTTRTGLSSQPGSATASAAAPKVAENIQTGFGIRIAALETRGCFRRQDSKER